MKRLWCSCKMWSLLESLPLMLNLAIVTSLLTDPAFLSHFIQNQGLRLQHRIGPAWVTGCVLAPAKLSGKWYVFPFQFCRPAHCKHTNLIHSGKFCPDTKEGIGAPYQTRQQMPTTVWVLGNGEEMGYETMSGSSTLSVWMYPEEEEGYWSQGGGIPKCQSSSSALGCHLKRWGKEVFQTRKRHGHTAALKL